MLIYTKPSTNHLCLIGRMWLSEVLTSLKVSGVFRWRLGVWLCRQEESHCSSLFPPPVCTFYTKATIKTLCVLQFWYIWGILLICRACFKIHVFPEKNKSRCNVWLPPHTPFLLVLNIYNLSTSSSRLFETYTWSSVEVRPENLLGPSVKDQASFGPLFQCVCLHMNLCFSPCVWSHVSTHTYTTWRVCHYLCRGFRLAGFTRGEGCYTISNICNVWLMSEWVNPPWHRWMCSAAFHLSDEVTPHSPPAWQPLFFFASYLLGSDLVCWLSLLFSYRLRSSAS